MKMEVVDTKVLAESVYRETLHLQRGDVLTHDVIIAGLGIQPHTAHWPEVMRRVRRDLRELRGIATWPAQGLGYRLLTEKEQIFELPVWRKKKQFSQGKKLRSELEAMPVDGLSDHERNALTRQQDQLKSAQKKIKREIQEASILYRARTDK